MFEPELDQETKPLRLDVYTGMAQIMQLLLTPDSSGRTACFLLWDDQASMAATVLTLCTIPCILLDQRSQTSKEWEVLTGFAHLLRDEAFFLRDGTHYPPTK